MKEYRYKSETKILVGSTILGLAIWIAAIIFVFHWKSLEEQEVKGMIFVILFPLGVIGYHIYSVKKVEKQFLEIHPQQFPDVHEYLKESAQAYGIPVPKAYISLEEPQNPCRGDFGLRPYVLIGTDFYAGCRENNTPEALRFMVAHQVAHIAANHGKAWWYILGGAFLNIPVLKALLIHSQEYTADAAAASIAPEGAAEAIQLCAVGKDNYVYGNIAKQIEKGHKPRSFFNKLLYKFSKYPSYLTRIWSLADKKLIKEPTKKEKNG